MNTQIIPFNIESHQIRAVADEQGEPWFVATDVCIVLGYANPWDAIKKHCREKGLAKREVLTEGGKQEVTIINEGNLYRLIIKCRLPVAERLEELVCDEILPTIRKTGKYEKPQAITTGQQNALQQIVKRIAAGDGKRTVALWSRFNNHFRLGSYKHLNPDLFAEAVTYLEGISGEYLPKPEPVNALRELPAEPQTSPLDAIFSSEVEATRQKFYKWLDACRAQMKKAGIEEPAWPDVDVEQLALAMMCEQIGMMRFQLFIDRHQKLHVSTIPRDARITTAEQLPDMIANGGAQVPKAVLPKIIEAVAKRMQC